MGYYVKDLMSPISEYATVPKGSTLLDAVRALEKAQAEFKNNNFQHRRVMVTDSDGKIIGKLSQMTVLHALEFGNRQSVSFTDIEDFGFTSKFITDVREQRKIRYASMEETCAKIITMNVEEFMKIPSPGEYVDKEASLGSIAHQFLKGSHLSLLVTAEKDEIVGILSLSNVSGAIFRVMQELENTGQKTINAENQHGTTIRP